MRHTSFSLPTLARGAGLLLVLGVSWPAASQGSDTWLDIFGPPPEGSGSWTKHFRAGALVGFNLKAEFSMSGSFPVAGGNPGTAGGGQNHDYDDGYVRRDATGNDGNLTWNWGYESADQLQANQLTFHSTQSFSASDRATVDANPQVGFDTAYGGHLTKLWGGDLGWEFGFGFLPINIKEDLSTVATATRMVHSFDTGGILLPPAPYQGSFDGPGATISDEAIVGPVENNVPATLGGSHTLDVILYNFRLGPTLQWELHPRVAVAVSAGAAFGLVTGDLKYNETLQFTGGSTANNQGQVGETQFVYGGYISGMLLYHAVRNGDLYVGLQYMPMSTATFSGGGREAKLDLTGGLYLSAGINWPF